MKPKTLFIETRRRINPKDIDLSSLDKLPGKTISLAATIQYLDIIPIIKKHLEKQGKTTIIKQGAKHQAHVLGCNSTAFDKSADTLLLIADGKFHAINNAIQLQSPIYIYNTKTLEQITKQDIEAENTKTKAKLNKFLTYNLIGIIQSTKPGQTFPYIYSIKQKLENKGKKTYIFKSDNINLQELENFPQIKIWLNTACPGLARDSNNMINLQDIQEFL